MWHLKTVKTAEASKKKLCSNSNKQLEGPQKQWTRGPKCPKQETSSQGTEYTFTSSNCTL